MAVKNVVKVRMPVEDTEEMSVSTNGKRGKPKRPKGTSNADWFKVISGGRMLKALKALKGIARCSNPDAYDYSEKQVARIMRDLREAVDAVEHAFAEPSRTIKTRERYW